MSDVQRVPQSHQAPNGEYDDCGAYDVIYLGAGEPGTCRFGRVHTGLNCWNHPWLFLASLYNALAFFDGSNRNEHQRQHNRYNNTVGKPEALLILREGFRGVDKLSGHNHAADTA